MVALNESRSGSRSLFLSQWVFDLYQKLLIRQLRQLGVHVAERYKSERSYTTRARKGGRAMECATQNRSELPDMGQYNQQRACQ